MGRTLFSFEQRFKTFTGADWSDDPAARIVSYHAAISIGAAQPGRPNPLFMRALDVFEAEPDEKAKRGLVLALDRTVLRNPMLFDTCDPKDIYQKIFRLYEKQEFRRYVPALAELGLDIALQAPNGSKQDIFNHAVEKIDHRLSWRTAQDYLPALRRLDWLVTSHASLATPRYVEMCASLLHLVVPQDVRARQPHQAAEYRRYEYRLPVFYETLKHNLLTLTNGVREKRPGLLPANELFTPVARQLIGEVSRDTLSPAYPIAARVLLLIRSLPPESPSAFMRKAGLAVAESRPVTKEFESAHRSLFQRFRWLLTPLNRPLRVLAITKHLRSAPCNLQPK